MQSDFDGRNLLVNTRRMVSFTKISNGLAVVHWVLRREGGRVIMLLHAGQLGRQVQELTVVDDSRTKEEVWMGPISSSQT